MVAAKLRQRRSLLINAAGFMLALAISAHIIPVPSPSQVVSAAVQTVAAIANPKTKPVEMFFPIEGHSYSASIVTDGFGSPRADGRIHAGVDLAPSNRFRVLTVMSGIVDELKPDSSVGGVIGITGKDSQGNAITLRYVHLDRAPLRRFRVGQRISAGKFLSTVSTTFPGSTGPHLHYERYVNNSLDRNVERSLTWTKALEVARA